LGVPKVPKVPKVDGTTILFLKIRNMPITFPREVLTVLGEIYDKKE
jgi:hypothetical protein